MVSSEEGTGCLWEVPDPGLCPDLQGRASQPQMPAACLPEGGPSSQAMSVPRRQAAWLGVVEEGGCFSGSKSISDFGAPQNKVYHCFHCFPIYFCHEVMGPDAMILLF